MLEPLNLDIASSWTFDLLEHIRLLYLVGFGEFEDVWFTDESLSTGSLCVYIYLLAECCWLSNMFKAGNFWHLFGYIL